MIKDPWFDNEKKNAFPSNFVWNINNNIDESEILPDPFNSSTEIGSFLKDFEFQPSRAPASTSSLEDVDEVMARFSIFRKNLNELKKRKRSKIKNQPNSTKSKDNKVISSNKKKQTFFDKFKQSLGIRQESLDDEREEKEAIEEQEKREKIRESIVRDQKLKAEKEAIEEQEKRKKIRESIVRDQKLKAEKEKAEKKEKIQSKKLQDLVNLINKHYEGRENPYSEYAKNSF